MRLIFAGTPEFAATALAALIDAEHTLALVLTQPDRPAGRGMRLVPSPVKQLAARHGLDIFQPLSLKRDTQAWERLAAAQADALIVAAYGLILPQEVLDIPPLGGLNIHASLLPRWRGAAPIQRALLAGDAASGVCIMQMAAGLDTGPVLARAATPITAQDTAATLHDRLAALGAALLLDTLPRLPMPGEAQAATGVTYAEKIEKAEARLDWRQSAATLDRHIRAFNPFPAAHTLFEGAPLKIWRAHPVPQNPDASSAEPGVILAADKHGITVACGADALCLTELQKAGGKRLTATQFLAGHALSAGETVLV
jgi:methionyl-tRNA formyltransferase